MKAIYSFEDEHTGHEYLIIPKIREVQTALGSIVVTFDNGDKKSYSVPNLKQEMERFLLTIDAFYNNHLGR